MLDDKLKNQIPTYLMIPTKGLEYNLKDAINEKKKVKYLIKITTQSSN